MGQLSANRIFKAFCSLFSSTDTTDEALLKSTAFRTKVRVYLTDGGTAGTAQTATTFFTNDYGCSMLVVSAKLITPVAVTADANNKLTCTLDKVDSGGANAATISAYTSDVAGGSTVAGVPKALTDTVANKVLLNGWSLRAAVSKAGTGVAMAAATSQAYLEVILEPTD